MQNKVVKTELFQKTRKIKLFLPLFLCLLFSSFDNKKTTQPVFEILTSDSVHFEVHLSTDKHNTAQNYISHIKAPVCEDGLCYDVELMVYWDLTGNFERFELLPEKPLTKLKHIPFTPGDYQKLTELLSTSSPTLSKYRKQELTTKIQNIDGVTGATVAAVKEETIPGAVYTCFTLWHLIHGNVADSIRKNTSGMLSGKVVKKIIDYKSESGDYYLLQYLSDKEFTNNLPDLLPLSIRNNWYFSKLFFESVPETLVANSEFQQFFAGNYSKIEYPGQIYLLKKLQNKSISNQLAISLLNGISGNTAQTGLTLQLICFSPNEPDDTVLKLMVDKIRDQSIRLHPEISGRLLILLKNRKALKPELKALKKHLKQRE